jgi:polyphenol oxidase
MEPTRTQNLTLRSREQSTGVPDAEQDAPFRLDEYAVGVWPGRDLWHGFLGRRGGVSRGPYESLNLSYLCGDDSADVRTNWRRVQACLASGAEVVQVNQVHGNRVHAADRQSRGIIATGDGIVTAATGIVLGILTADCVPVLLHDPDGQVVGALHAGWRGVIADIAPVGIHAMMALGAKPWRIEAALGPAIGACCFEADASLGRRFEAEIAGAASHVRGAGEKAFIDLKGVLRDQLTRAGLENNAIVSVPVCTKCSSDRFFSRRAAGGAITGLQLSFIGLRE